MAHRNKAGTDGPATVQRMSVLPKSALRMPPKTAMSRPGSPRIASPRPGSISSHVSLPLPGREEAEDKEEKRLVEVEGRSQAHSLAVSFVQRVRRARHASG